MKLKILITSFLILNIILNVYSQGEISDDEKLAYRNEKSIGVALNTNGYGFDFRKGTYINIHKTRIFYYNFNIIKHEKEYKQTNVYPSSTNNFVYGKLNSCADLRFGYGIQKQIFQKSDEGSVEVRIYGYAGPAIGFLKPIYYDIKVDDTTKITEKYLPSHQPGLIIGKAPFSKGLSEIKINPGAFINIGIGFEHGKNEYLLNSLDLGISASVYLFEMEIMASDPNTNYYPNSHFIFSLFVCYRIGKFSLGKHLSKTNEEEGMF